MAQLPRSSSYGAADAAEEGRFKAILFVRIRFQKPKHYTQLNEAYKQKSFDVLSLVLAYL